MSSPAASSPDVPPLTVAGRTERLRALLGSTAAALLVTDPVEVRWCTGFTGSSGWVVVLPDRVVFGTDGRYADRATEELAAARSDAAEVVVDRTREARHRSLVSLLAGIGPVGASATRCTHAAWTELAADVDLVPADAVFAEARRCKDAAELARIERAALLASMALAEVAPRLGDGLTEREVRRALDEAMRSAGADGPGYATIVAAGPEHAARPHHDATDRRIVDGDLVVIDVGAEVDGYRSDMTRTFAVGGPTAAQVEWYELVASCQRAALDVVGAGVPAADVDRAARSVAERAGLAAEYLHGTGHGVGLEIHEAPMCVPGSTAVLGDGDVVTVEPGLYRAGVGGVRIEDLVVVTGAGHRNLTTTPKDGPCLPSPPTT